MSEKDEFIRLIPASHEAVEKLDLYAAMLTEWNDRFNLVAPSTLPHIWSRHFLDSAQLMPLMPSGQQILADLGSGAGFPGLVLNIMGKKDVHLIESTGKKADFLRAVIEKLGLDAVVHQKRVEDIKDFKADIVTARALASLRELFKLANPVLKKNGLCLFLKGQKADEELTESRKYWMFDCKKTQSLSGPDGAILAIRNITYVYRNPKTARRKS